MQRSRHGVVLGLAFALAFVAFPVEAAPKIASVQNVKTTTQYNSASLRWSLSSGTAPSRFTIKCATGKGTAITVNAQQARVTLTGLKAGKKYTCTLIGIRGSRKSISKTISFSTLSYSVPSTPLAVVAEARVSAVRVQWSVPTNTGGRTITAYEVTSVPTSNGCISTSTSCIVTGLKNGTSYRFYVQALNAIGPSAKSAISNIAVPFASTNAIDNIGVAAGDAFVDLSWTLKHPVSNIRIEVDGATTELSGEALTHQLTGLTNCVPTHVALRTVTPQQVSDAVELPITAGLGIAVPSSVQQLKATVGSQRVTVTFARPLNGDNVTHYNISANGGAVTRTINATSATDYSADFTGLTNGTTYTFTVIAVNGCGTHVATSADRIAATPRANPSGITSISTSPGDGFVDVSWQFSHASDKVLVDWSDGSSELLGTTTSYRVVGTNCMPKQFHISTAVGAATSEATTLTVTPGAGVAVPASVRNLQAIVSSRRVTLSFNAPLIAGDISQYNITAVGGATPITRAITPDGNLSFTTVFNDLVNEIPYTFTVVAVNGCGTHSATEADSITATPTWAKPSVIVDLDNPDAVTQTTLGSSVGFKFSAQEDYTATDMYFALKPLCSSNSVTWNECAASLSIQLYTADGTQLVLIQYSYSVWNGIGIVPLRPGAPLTVDAEYLLVVTLVNSSAPHTAVDVLSQALVW